MISTVTISTALFVLLMSSGLATTPVAVRSGAVEPAPGFAAWFKADAIVGLSDGDPVGLWEDSSTSNKDASQSTAAFKPIFKSNAVNGNPVVRFDGIDDRLVSAGQFGIWGLTNHFTVFAVVRLDSLPGSGSHDVVGSSATSNNLDLIARRSDSGGNWLAYSSSPDGVRNSTLVLPTDSWHVLTWRLHANSPRHLQIRADTVYYLNDTAYTGIGTAPSQAAIGGRQNGVKPFRGDIAELIFYTNSLSDADMRVTEDYLIEKYGIGQPPDPYDLAHEDRCELVSQVLIGGEPASLREWALVYAGGCEQYEGGEALAHVLRENRYAQTQSLELDLLVKHGVVSMRDRALFEAALEVATDASAGERARVEAMRILNGQLHPGQLGDYEAVVDPEVPYTRSTHLYSGAGREGEPLPPNASELVATELRAVAEDPSAPPAVRAAAQKIGRE